MVVGWWGRKKKIAIKFVLEEERNGKSTRK